MKFYVGQKVRVLRDNCYREVPWATKGSVINIASLTDGVAMCYPDGNDPSREHDWQDGSLSFLLGEIEPYVQDESNQEVKVGSLVKIIAVQYNHMSHLLNKEFEILEIHTPRPLQKRIYAIKGSWRFSRDEIQLVSTLQDKENRKKEIRKQIQKLVEDMQELKNKILKLQKEFSSIDD